MVYCNFLYLGDSEVIGGSDELDGYAYMLVANRGCQQIHLAGPGEGMHYEFYGQTAGGVVHSAWSSEDLGE